MFDTTGKFETLRSARAEALVPMSEKTIRAVNEGRVPKGNVLEMARAAAVLAAKKTPDIIPFCHPLSLDFVGMEYEIEKSKIRIRSEMIEGGGHLPA